jgi:tetratricopeptide (TPR) repeat protein
MFLRRNLTGVLWHHFRIEEAEAIWFSVLFQDELEQLEIGSQQLLQLLIREAASYHQKGYLTAAEKIYLYVLQQEPDSAKVHHALGTVLADRGQSDFAIQLYQKAIELDANYLESYVDLGCCLLDRGNFIEAYNCLYHAILREPDNLLYRKWLAIALSHLTFNIPSPEVIQELKKCFAEKEIYKLNLITPTISILKSGDDFKTVLSSEMLNLATKLYN